MCETSKRVIFFCVMFTGSHFGAKFTKILYDQVIKTQSDDSLSHMNWVCEFALKDHTGGFAGFIPHILHYQQTGFISYLYGMAINLLKLEYCFSCILYYS